MESVSTQGLQAASESEPGVKETSDTTQGNGPTRVLLRPLSPKLTLSPSSKDLGPLPTCWLKLSPCRNGWLE